MELCPLENLPPVRDVARGEEGVFAGVPSQEVWRVGVAGMSFAVGPNFIEEKSAGAFLGTV